MIRSLIMALSLGFIAGCVAHGDHEEGPLARFFSASYAAQSVELNDGLVLWWDFSSTNDASGSGATGFSLFGPAVLTNGLLFLPTNAIVSFNTGHGGAYTTNAPNLLSGAGSFTVSLWLRAWPHPSQSGAYYRNSGGLLLVDKYFFRVAGLSGSKNYIYISPFVVTGNVVEVRSTQSVVATWRHIAMENNIADGIATLYMDGQREITYRASNHTNQWLYGGGFSTNAFIGIGIPNSLPTWQRDLFGYFDNFKIWNRSLSADEIYQVYLEGHDEIPEDNP